MGGVLKVSSHVQQGIVTDIGQEESGIGIDAARGPIDCMQICLTGAPDRNTFLEDTNSILFAPDPGFADLSRTSLSSFRWDETLVNKLAFFAISAAVTDSRVIVGIDEMTPERMSAVCTASDSKSACACASEDECIYTLLACDKYVCTTFEN